MQISSSISVKIKWDTFDYPIRRGTPISATGQLANNGNAVGIIPQTIYAKPDADAWTYIMTGGTAELSEIDYPSLSQDAMRVLNGITFYGSDGTPAVDPVYDQYTLPAATDATLGGVMAGSGLSVTSGGVLSVSAATASVIGGVMMAANVPDAAGDAPTAEEFKALLDALKEAGIMEPDAGD